jgi:hypothetical protein
MTVGVVVCEGVTPDFTKRTPAECELRCKCCIKLKIELSEALSELKSAKETIIILKDELDISNLSEYNTST